MRRFLCLVVFLAVFLGCGGGKRIQMPEGGVKLSYAPAVGKTLGYRTIVQKYIQTSEKGTSITRLVKGDVRFTVKVTEAGEGGQAKMEYRFDDVSVGVFVNGQLQGSEEVEEMKDVELTVSLDSTGAVADIEGIDLEEELQKEEISPLEFLLSFPIPKEKVTVGYSWHDEQDTVVEDEQTKISQKVVQDFTVVDFVLVDSFRCVVCQVSGKINIHRSGEVEQEDGTYDVDITMDGDIKGKIYFDVDNGVIVRYESNKMVDVRGTQVDVESGEKKPISYYTQETFDARLQRITGASG